MIRPRRSSAACGVLGRQRRDGRRARAQVVGARSPVVSANQNRDRPVSTRPLSGIGVGRTTSNADSRSEATSRSVSASTSYRSRTLPERRNDSASGIDDLRGTARAAASGRARHGPPARARADRGGRSRPAHGAGASHRRSRRRAGPLRRAATARVGGQQVAQRATLVGRAQGGRWTIA